MGSMRGGAALRGLSDGMGSLGKGWSLGEGPLALVWSLILLLSCLFYQTTL